MKLLECPFCTDVDDSCRPFITVDNDYSDRYAVVCGYCENAIARGDSEAEAIENWNDRNLPKSHDYDRGYAAAIRDIRNKLDSLPEPPNAN